MIFRGLERNETLRVRSMILDCLSTDYLHFRTFILNSNERYINYVTFSTVQIMLEKQMLNCLTNINRTN